MWLLYALVSAVLESFTSLFRKQATTGREDFKHIPILTVGVMLPFSTTLAVYSLFEQGTGNLGAVAIFLLLNIMFNATAVWMRYRAIKIGDISELEPLTMLTPMFLLFTSWIMLGEQPPLAGVAGVLLVSLGALYLTASIRGVNVFDSIKTIWHKRASKLMILVVIIWSITSNLDKLITDEIPILLYLWLLHLGIFTTLLVVHRPKKHQLASLWKAKGLIITGVGITSFAAMGFQLLAIQSIFVSYAIAIRRVDVLLTIALGYYVLKEGNIKRRILGSLLMLAGVLIITLS